MNDTPTKPSRRGRMRLLFGATCAAVLAVGGTVIATATSAYAEADRTVCSNTTGTHNGFYFSFWKDSGNASMTLRADGRYSSNWGSGTNNWVGGKGWATGSRRTISYSGSYNPNGNSYLALYGWTRNPLIEYYVVENFGTYNPSSGATRMGSVTTDGGTYDILPQPAGQPAVDRRHRHVLPVLERPPAEAHRRHHHHRQPLRRLGPRRLEPRHQPQLPGHGHRGLPEQRELRHHRPGRRRRQPRQPDHPAARKPAATAPRRCPPASSGATGSTSTSRSAAPATGSSPSAWAAVRACRTAGTPPSAAPAEPSPPDRTAAATTSG